MRDCSTSVCFITSMVWVTRALFSSILSLKFNETLHLGLLVPLYSLFVQGNQFAALSYLVQFGLLGWGRHVFVRHKRRTGLIIYGHCAPMFRLHYLSFWLLLQFINNWDSAGKRQSPASIEISSMLPYDSRNAARISMFCITIMWKLFFFDILVKYILLIDRKLM